MNAITNKSYNKLKVLDLWCGDVVASSFLILSALSRSASAIAILSLLEMEQLSVFLGTKQLVLNNIAIWFRWIWLINLARAVVCTYLRILCLCCCHLILKEVPVKLIYFLSLTFALYTLFSRHSPLNGQFALYLQ